MNLASLIRPWPVLRLIPRRSNRIVVRRRSGARVVAMGFILPLILSVYAAYYAAYVYWVALVLVAFFYLVLAKLAVRAVKSIIRKVRK